MSSKLSATNPYLRDPVLRRRNVLRSVASSSAIEGIHAPFKQLARAAKKAKAATISKTRSVPKTRITRRRP
jgi:Fic family protein